jgi:regulator of protease activity HflC (stomatin/prohibitin superfamily)
MRKSVIAIIIIVLVVLYTSIFVVKEGERGITLRSAKFCVTAKTNRWFMSRACTSRCRLFSQ